MEAKLLVAHVRVDDSILTADVLQVGAELWLVAKWIELPGGSGRTPGRAIRMDPAQVQRPGALGADLVLNQRVPRAVLDGRTAGGLEVVEGPSDRFGLFPNQRAGH